MGRVVALDTLDVSSILPWTSAWDGSSKKDGSANVPRHLPPRLGEHSAAVLQDWLGMGAGEADGLRARSII